MIKILRELKFSNGKISVTNRLENIEVMAVKDDKIVETKVLPMSICDNKVILDNIISSMKGSHTLLYIEDDRTSILTNTNKRYVIRGTGSAIHVFCSMNGSSYIKQTFLPYNYKDLSFNDYINLFGYT